jgi:UDP-N-acetylmuramate: L-alanyl-gamma-D-glutamyl-meso-diaminopimelate ligase
MKVFLSGIAGTGMSSLAGLFSEKGYEVYGSDENFYPPVDKILSKMNAKIYSGFSQSNIPADVDFCVIGNVISRGNPEAEFILNEGIEFYSMAEALYKYFVRGKESIVVAGTHGKTTISSFVTYLLSQAGLDPGFFIGGKPLDFETNFKLGSGSRFVIEGDEYETSFFDRSSKFLKYFPKYLILTALEYDHVDFFPTEELYAKSFINLVNQVPSEGLIVVNGDFEMNQTVVKKSFAPVVTFGKGNHDFQITNIGFEKDHYCFNLVNKSAKLEFRSFLLGKYNIWNLCAGIILGMHLGIAEDVLKQTVETFQGVERRLKVLNKIKNTLFIEDFAHHPTSIRNVLESVAERYPEKKIITLFEPRSWSLRRNLFQDELARSFIHLDELVIKEVFQKEKIPERERLDVKKIKQDLGKNNKKVLIFNQYEEIIDYLKTINLSIDQVILIISNGDFGGIPGFIKELSD